MKMGTLRAGGAKPPPAFFCQRRRNLVPALALAAALAVAPWAAAQEAGQPGAVRLSLAGALSRAREQALELTAAGARKRAAEAQLRQARAVRLPTVQLQEMWNRTDSPAEAFAFQLNQERFSFPAFTQSDPNDPDPLSTALTRLEVSLPLYTGGEISSRVEQARWNAAAAESRSAWTGDNAALAAAEAYILLSQARQNAALLQSSRQTVARHVDLARAFVEQGMLVRSDLLRAEVELARIEEMLAEAEGNARVAESLLAFRLGADLTTSFELDPLPEEPAAGASLEEWQALSASRADLEAARRMLAAGELEEEVRRAALLPRVGLTLRHDLFDDRPLGAHGDSSYVAAMVGWELWSGGRHRAAAAAARAEAEAGRAEVEQMARGIRLEVEQAWQELQTSLIRRRTSERALEAAREAERIVEERFKSGVARTIDWLDAATARREAETRELVARAQAQLAAFRLAVRAGRAPETVLANQRPGKESSQ